MTFGLIERSSPVIQAASAVADIIFVGRQKGNGIPFASYIFVLFCMFPVFYCLNIRPIIRIACKPLLCTWRSLCESWRWSPLDSVPCCQHTQAARQSGYNIPSSTMSINNDPSQNMKAALEHLRFNKNHAAVNQSSISNGQPSKSYHPSSSYPPPQQSRDATISSHYFYNPPNMGNVLVPSSSPILQPAQPNYTPYSHSPTNNTPQPGGFSNHSNQPSSSTWGAYGGYPAGDPLSAPTGFTTHGGAPYMSPSHSHGSNSGRSFPGANGHYEEGPPRKRLNRGPDPNDSLDLFAVPSTPQSIAHSPPDHLTRDASMHSMQSSDDELPRLSDVASSSSSRRIIRNGAGAPTTSPALNASHSSEDEETKRFTRFKMMQPMEAPGRIKAAWDEAEGDEKKASALLCNPSWSPKTITSPTLSREAIGRVKEIDDATKAQRAATKEKGKKSMIYANRTVLESRTGVQVTPQAVKTAAVDTVTPNTPTSPDVRMPRRRLVKRRVDSESEAENSDASEDRKIQPEASPLPAPIALPTTRHKPLSGEAQALSHFNTKSAGGLQEITGCTLEQANKIIELRPYSSVAALESKLGQGKKKAGPAGISPRLFEDCVAVFEGYQAVDEILQECESIGANLRSIISSWSIPSEASSTRASTPSTTGQFDDGSLSLRSLDTANKRKPKDFLLEQPSIIAEGVRLKDYQLLGVNWLRLLHRKKLSCILADEMGLGKTIQVISFIAHLKEMGNKGPHLIVVPSSTLENWCREFARFAPTVAVQTYYAGKEERSILRQTLWETMRSNTKDDEGWEVLVTTYNLAQGDSKDKKFFGRIEWDSAIFDEGHQLKNFQSQRYQALLKYPSQWRLLLTGTPLQNNLQELVSLMNFILPETFGGQIEKLRAIFKVKGDSKIGLLSQERISRAKKMMTPFVLRRRKDQVLKDLPNKHERIEWCEMTSMQKRIYKDAIARSRKTIFDADASIEPAADAADASRRKQAKPQKGRSKDKRYLENSTNVLMDLRKAASHPMLFRKLFSDSVLDAMTKQLMKEPDFRTRGAVAQFVKEDMEVMTDAELQLFAKTYKSTQKFLQDEKCYLDAGKITVLLKLMNQYKEEGRKMLIFSQFTQILDILQAVLKQKDIKYLLLTGSTPVDVRQSLVDEFSEDSSIPVFLLSTKAGGMGLNLTAASVVIMFDQDFNPHNDRQAQDRAYRIGQKRDVDVVKLITRGSIEEDMLQLGQTKIALDEAVAGDPEEGGDKETEQEKEMKKGLLDILRNQLSEEDDRSEDRAESSKPETPPDSDMNGEKKKGSLKDGPATKTTKLSKPPSKQQSTRRKRIVDSDDESSSLTDVETMDIT